MARKSFCKYCHENIAGLMMSLDKNGHTCLMDVNTEPKLHIKYYNKVLDIKINNCPRCGRQLGKVW